MLATLLIITTLGMIWTVVAGHKALAMPGIDGQLKSQSRLIWPSVILLSAAALTALAIILLAIVSAMYLKLLFWMLVAGAALSVASILASTWAPRGLRITAQFAAAIWLIGFGLITGYLYILGMLSPLPL